jgi:hypothetical protein
MQNLLNSESLLSDQAWPIWERHPGPWAEASSSLQMCEMRFDHIARNRHSDTSEGLHEEQMGILDSFPQRLAGATAGGCIHTSRPCSRGRANSTKLPTVPRFLRVVEETDMPDADAGNIGQELCQWKPVLRHATARSGLFYAGTEPH